MVISVYPFCVILGAGCMVIFSLSLYIYIYICLLIVYFVFLPEPKYINLSLYALWYVLNRFLLNTRMYMYEFLSHKHLRGNSFIKSINYGYSQ